MGKPTKVETAVEKIQAHSKNYRGGYKGSRHQNNYKYNNIRTTQQYESSNTEIEDDTFCFGHRDNAARFE